MKLYSSWRLTFDALGTKDGFGNILNKVYKSPQAEQEFFQEQQNWMFAAFAIILKDPVAKDVLKQYQHSKDAQQIYAKLEVKACKSAKATLDKGKLGEFLTTKKLDHS